VFASLSTSLCVVCVCARSVHVPSCRDLFLVSVTPKTDSGTVMLIFQVKNQDSNQNRFYNTGNLY
jgi:hypothetical protein